MSEMAFGKRFLLNIGIGACISALAIALHAEKIYTQGWVVVLADAFTLSFVILFGAFALRSITCSGFFDLLFYGSRRLVALVYPPAGVYRESYYDYKMRKRGHGGNVMPTGIAALVFLVPAVTFTLLFYL